MFKSLNLIHGSFDGPATRSYYAFMLIDSDFECVLNSSFEGVNIYAEHILLIAKEYHNRGLDVVKNTYLAIDYKLNDWYPDYTFLEVLDYLNNEIKPYNEQYLTFDVNGLDFNRDIYPGIKEMYEKLNTFK